MNIGHQMNMGLQMHMGHQMSMGLLMNMEHQMNMGHQMITQIIQAPMLIRGWRNSERPWQAGRGEKREWDEWGKGGDGNGGIRGANLIICLSNWGKWARRRSTRAPRGSMISYGDSSAAELGKGMINNREGCFDSIVLLHFPLGLLEVMTYVCRFHDETNNFYPT